MGQHCLTLGWGMANLERVCCPLLALASCEGSPLICAPISLYFPALSFFQCCSTGAAAQAQPRSVDAEGSTSSTKPQGSPQPGEGEEVAPALAGFSWL